MTHRLAIIGTGPAGYAAALYTAREEIETVLFAGEEPGGQLMKTAEVENYPGFSEGIVGPQLMDEMRKQATRFGAQIVWETVVKLNKPTEEQSNGKFEIETETGDKHEADAVILTMGAKSRMLGVGEEKYFGKGFSTCAVCDAAFYKGKNVYVVGGGDAAIEDAWALTNHAKSVTMLVRTEAFRASKVMQRRVLDNPDKIKVMWNTNLLGVKGETVQELLISVEGKEQAVPAEGLFLAIGHIPATSFLKGEGEKISPVQLDAKGYVVTAQHPGEAGVEMAKMRLKDGLVAYPTMTSSPGVFAAGDCVDFRYRQAATAAGMGVSAALDAKWWLESVGNSK